MSTACQRCGAVTEHQGAFREELRSFSFKRVFYCPDCFAIRKRREAKFAAVLAVLVVIIVIGSVFAAGEYWLKSIWALLNWLLITVCIFVMTVPHEWAHALCAHLLGWRVFKISLGCGRTLFQFRLGGLLHEFNLIPAGGATLMAPRQPRWIRVGYFLIIAAGPAFHVAVLAGLYAIYPLHDFIWPTLENAPALLAVVGCANAIMLAVNLFPWRHRMQLGGITQSIPSDGLAILLCPFMSRTQVEAMHAGFFAMESFECIQDRRYDEARAWNEKGLALYPNDFANQFTLALALHFLKDFQNARQLWRELVDRNDLDAHTLAVVLNNVAWVDLLIGGAELLEEAERFSHEALRAAPVYPPFLGTRGSVLIELGRTAEGLPLVRRAFDHNEDDRLKALNACFLAIGEAKCGNGDEALRWLENARTLHMECLLLEKAQRQVAIQPRGNSR